MNIISTELLITWIAVILYIISGTLAIFGMVFKKDRPINISLYFGWAGLIIHAIPILIRWVTAGHGPYYRIHEVVGSDVWIGVLFFLVLATKYKNLKVIGAFIMPVAFSLLAWATISDPVIRPLPLTFKSIWLIAHIIFAKLSIGSILLAFGLSVLYLFKSGHLKAMVLASTDGGAKEVDKSTKFYNRLPSLESMDDLAYRLVAFGFIFLGIMIVAGSIWAQQAWGRYWSWDPVETWSLVVWFLYGLFLHLRITYKFKGSRSAYLIIFALVISLIYHFGSTFITNTIHEGTSF